MTDRTPTTGPEHGGREGAAGGTGTRALEGWRVLVPHGGDWGDRVSGLLAAHGAEAVVVPLIEFAPPDDVAPLDVAIVALSEGAYDWVTVTSGTTVTALAGRAAQLVNPASPAAQTPGTALTAVLGRTRVAAVGPGTARVLERHGITPDLVPRGERSAAGLVAEFPPPAAHAAGPATTREDGVASTRDAGATRGAGAGATRDGGRATTHDAGAPTGRVLVPASDLAQPTVADGLRAAGWRVDEVIAYRTVSGPLPTAGLREDLRRGAFGAVLLSSGSTVTNMLELVGPPPASTLVCCIGPRTRRAAEDAGLPVHVVPAAASAEGLVDALARHVQTPAVPADRSPVPPGPSPVPSQEAR